MIELYFDGGCGPKNPGGIATFGFHVQKDGKTIYSAHGIMEEEKTSNNVAEYGALIMGLLYLLNNDYADQQIKVIGDSKLVISQMFRHWKIKKGLYTKYALYARDLLVHFSNIEGKLVPRRYNSHADSLTRTQKPPLVRVPHAYRT